MKELIGEIFALLRMYRERKIEKQREWMVSTDDGDGWSHRNWKSSHSISNANDEEIDNRRRKFVATSVSALISSNELLKLPDLRYIGRKMFQVEECRALKRTDQQKALIYISKAKLFAVDEIIRGGVIAWKIEKYRNLPTKSDILVRVTKVQIKAVQQFYGFTAGRSIKRWIRAQRESSIFVRRCRSRPIAKLSSIW